MSTHCDIILLLTRVLGLYAPLDPIAMSANHFLDKARSLQAASPNEQSMDGIFHGCLLVVSMLTLMLMTNPGKGLVTTPPCKPGTRSTCVHTNITRTQPVQAVLHRP